MTITLSEITARQALGRRIRTLRREFLQNSIADAMVARGHSTWRQTVLSRVENGTRELGFLEAVDLAEILGVSVSELVPRPDSEVRREVQGQMMQAARS